jgi:hypothetical protein
LGRNSCMNDFPLLDGTGGPVSPSHLRDPVASPTLMVSPMFVSIYRLLNRTNVTAE